MSIDSPVGPISVFKLTRREFIRNTAASVAASAAGIPLASSAARW